MTVAVRPPPRASRSSRVKPRQAEAQTLGVALDWIEAHCAVPDGFHRGRLLSLYEWQARFLGNFYLVRRDAVWDPARPILGPAFVHRRAGMVGPQKLGKDPMEAAHICLEGDGPALFSGWAGADDGWSCRDHGCGCGWERPYEPGEPMGMRWSTPLIQVTAVSEDATANTYQALVPMIQLGPLSDRIPKTGEEFIRLPNGGRIDTVTASANSRLGQRVTFISQGEAGLYTKTNGMMKVADTQYRGVAGMGGRAAWHTNAWDPSEGSVAQREHEHPSPDVYIQFDRPPAGLSFTVKADRWKIYKAVYPTDVRREQGGHLDLDSVDAEATGMAEYDAAQAARFFGNQLVTGSGRAFDLAVWADRTAAHACTGKLVITIGFDGSKSGDHTALIATCVTCGFQWPLGMWVPETHGGEIPRDIVDAAVDAAFATHRVVRMYADPPYWKDELAAWMGRYGDKVVLRWETWRNRAMGYAVRSYAQAMTDGALSHDGDEAFTRYIGNAQRKPLNERDDKGVNLWVIQKETPDSPRKVDGAVAAVLSWEARMDAISAGALTPIPEVRFISFEDDD